MHVGFKSSYTSILVYFLFYLRLYIHFQEIFIDFRKIKSKIIGIMMIKVNIRGIINKLLNSSGIANGNGKM